MNITLECLPCFVNHTLGVLKEFSADEVLQQKVLRNVLRKMSELDFASTPPEFAAEIHQFIREQLDSDDPYQQIKRDSNDLARQLVQKLEPRLKEAQEPLRCAVLYSIAGNIIDSGVSAVTSLDSILESIEMAESHTPEIDDFAMFKQSLSLANRILILGDNAGEVFFDRLLLDTIPAGKELFYAVKAGPILNDAVREDAYAAGIDKLATVIDNGTRVPGTPLEKVSPEFLQVFEQADMIISKGQANFETLSHVADARVFFLLRAKCGVIAKKAGVSKGSFVIINNRKII